MNRYQTQTWYACIAASHTCARKTKRDAKRVSLSKACAASEILHCALDQVNSGPGLQRKKTTDNTCGLCHCTTTSHSNKVQCTVSLRYENVTIALCLYCVGLVEHLSQVLLGCAILHITVVSRVVECAVAYTDNETRNLAGLGNCALCTLGSQRHIKCSCA